MNHVTFSLVVQMADSSFRISTNWQGNPVSHAGAKLTLSGASQALQVLIAAPFFNDPPNPGGPKGEPFPQLWDYEVVELFFLNEKKQYLEVEFCPHGQYITLLLDQKDGNRNLIKDMLPLTFTSEVNEGSWQGRASIPLSYFPPGVNLFNAYAIHGSGEDRQYEALYPATQGNHSHPDFHRLEYFQPIAFSDIVKQSNTSDFWE